MVIVLAAIFGALFGSFLNVVIYRVPRGLSVVRPPSACPRCGRQIRGYDNVPILGWLWLRGRCRDCHEPISVRYPLVEAGTSAAFGLVTWWAQSSGLLIFDGGGLVIASGVLALVALLYLAAISIALALIDIDTQTLPNRIVLPSLVVVVLLLGAALLMAGRPAQLGGAFLGLLILGAFYGLIAFLYPRGMGMGDAKLALVLGFCLGWAGWAPLAVGAFAAFVLGGVFGVILLLFTRRGRKARIPFGPWMLAGAWIGLIWGDTVMGAYLKLAGLS